jgi:malic enzyme
MIMIGEKAPADPGANARRMAAERAACEGLGTAALESGAVADLIREAGAMAKNCMRCDGAGRCADCRPVLDALARLEGNAQ